MLLCYNPPMKQLEFEILRREDGSCEFDTYIRALPPKDRAKLTAVIEKTEQFGIETAIQQRWVKKLPDGIYELRSQHGSNIQRALYFHKVGPRYVITHGFTKKTQRTPVREIEKAKRLRVEYLERQKHDLD